MRSRILVLAAVAVFAYLLTGCATFSGSLCATGEWFDGDECVCKPGHVPDDDGKGCHRSDPMPTPEPSVEPTVPPTPAPTPEPTAPPTTPPPVACVLPKMPECGGPEGPPGIWGCCTMHVSGTGEFGALVEQAQDEADGHSELFDASGRVISEEAYTDVLVRYLRLHGVCATQGGPSDEIGVKNTNQQNEQFDVVFGNMKPRREGYVALCKPARF